MDADSKKCTTTNDTIKKRKVAHELFSSDSDDNDQQHFAQYLIVEPLDAAKPIKYSIFAIQKILLSAVGSVKSARKLRSGAVLIEVTSRAQYCNAMKMQMWVDIPVKVSEHRSLNSCRGVIRCRDFRDCDDTEVLEALRPEGVTDIKHIKTKRNGELQPTNTFILTFNRPQLPKSVRAAYMNISVEMYIPNPLRCYNCQKYGHSKTSCTRTAICARCGREGHQDADCNEAPQCANCKGSHASYAQACPEWQRQREITKLKYQQNITFPEAKRLVQQRSAPAGAVSYAAAAAAATTGSRRPVASASTQTDLTWPLDSKVPLPVAKLPLPTPAGSTSAVASSTQTAPTDAITTEAASAAAATSQKPTPNNQGKPTKATTNQSTKLSTKPSKGSSDPVKLYNKYGHLDGMDVEVGQSVRTAPKKPHI